MGDELSEKHVNSLELTLHALCWAQMRNDLCDSGIIYTAHNNAYTTNTWYKNKMYTSNS